MQEQITNFIVIQMIFVSQVPCNIAFRAIFSSKKENENIIQSEEKNRLVRYSDRKVKKKKWYYKMLALIYVNGE